MSVVPARLTPLRGQWCVVDVREHGAMSGPKDEAEFERIRIMSRMEKDRGIVAQYDEHQAIYRDRIERYQYELGRLDERLGDVA